jgi:hypothetical protein
MIELRKKEKYTLSTKEKIKGGICGLQNNINRKKNVKRIYTCDHCTIIPSFYKKKLPSMNASR